MMVPKPDAKPAGYVDAAPDAAPLTVRRSQRAWRKILLS